MPTKPAGYQWLKEQHGLGVIIPVSAHMLNNIRDYDAALEKYSKPLMQQIRV